MNEREAKRGVPKRGLGRGLGALLGEQRPMESATRATNEVPVDAIRPNPRQPRTAFDAESMAELEQSIRELGVLVPIIVRPLASAPGVYELVAGERRWRAATAAGLTSIPAIVREVDDRTSLEVAIVENLQRQGLDAIEEAMGFQHLIDEFGFTQERVAERVGKSRPTVANALRLLTLDDALKARLRRGALSVGHARALLALDPAIREAVAAQVERDQLTVRDVERMGAKRQEAPSAPRVAVATPRKSPDLEAVESRLRYRLGAPVGIVSGATGDGRIEIRFSSQGDLARIVDLLLAEDA
jgi:ParB family chromosome partitioning protein